MVPPQRRARRWDSSENRQCSKIKSLEFVKGDTLMVRFGIVMTAALVLLVAIAAPLAQAQAPGDGAPKPSKVMTTRERLGEMLAKWRHNRPKLKACRTEASKKGLAGDDRWFFISECMGKS
jgi:psiF repeat